MTYLEKSKAYLAIKEMVRYHPTYGQHTLLLYSVLIMQKLAHGFTVYDALHLLEKAEKECLHQ